MRVTDALSARLPGMDETPALGVGRMRGLCPDDATCFPVAEVVEAPIVNVALFGGAPVSLDALSAANGGVATRAARRGLEIVLEFVPGTAMPDLGSAHHIAGTCGEPNCRILLDPWHLARSGGTLADVAAPAGTIGAFQLDDRVARRPARPMCR